MCSTVHIHFRLQCYKRYTFVRFSCLTSGLFNLILTFELYLCRFLKIIFSNEQIFFLNCLSLKYFVQILGNLTVNTRLIIFGYRFKIWSFLRSEPYCSTVSRQLIATLFKHHTFVFIWTWFSFRTSFIFRNNDSWRHRCFKESFHFSSEKKSKTFEVGSKVIVCWGI